MNTKNINFDDKKNFKKWLLQKTIFNVDDTDVNKILVSKKETYGKYNLLKYFNNENKNTITMSLRFNNEQLILKK